MTALGKLHRGDDHPDERQQWAVRVIWTIDRYQHE